MNAPRRYNATQVLLPTQCLQEIDALKWAVSSLRDAITKPGSMEREVFTNAAKGIDARLDYLHDSVSHYTAKLAAAKLEA